jgi:hypothetical protein
VGEGENIITDNDNKKRIDPEILPMFHRWEDVGGHEIQTLISALCILGDKNFYHQGHESHKEIRSHFNINHV